MNSDELCATCSDRTELEQLLALVDETATWLIGYCCSYRGPNYGQKLQILLADYRKTLDGHR